MSDEWDKDRKALENCAHQVLRAGFTTGHADTVEELMEEVLEQAQELRDRVQDCEGRALPPAIPER